MSKYIFCSQERIITSCTWEPVHHTLHLSLSFMFMWHSCFQKVEAISPRLASEQAPLIHMLSFKKTQYCQMFLHWGNYKFRKKFMVIFAHIFLYGWSVFLPGWELIKETNLEWIWAVFESLGKERTSLTPHFPSSIIFNSVWGNGFIRLDVFCTFPLIQYFLSLSNKDLWKWLFIIYA